MEKFNKNQRDIQTISNLKMEEAKSDSVVDGEFVIGKVSGEFFVPGGFSRNKRYYSKSLWEKTLNDPRVVEKLNNRNMFGTVGHKTVIDEDALIEEKISHFMGSLKIDEKTGKGVGDAYLLNTKAGRAVRTLMGAKCQIYTSSRADGQLMGEYMGAPRVDEDSYALETFDFVLDPGFLEANPKLVESLEDAEGLGLVPEKKDYDNNNNEGDKGELDMDPKIWESVINEKSNLQKELQDALTDKSSVEHKLESLKNENSTLTKQVEEMSDKIAKLQKYENVGTPEKVAESVESLRTAESQLKSYKKYGSPAKIGEALQKFEEVLKTRDEMDEILGTESINGFEEIKEKVKTIGESINTLGEDKFFSVLEGISKVSNKIDIENIEEEAKLLVDYKKMGTLEELNKGADLIKTQIEENNSKRVSELSDKCNVSEAKVKNLIDKGLTDKEIVETFEDHKSHTINNRFRKNENDSSDRSNKGPSFQQKVFGLTESVGSRIM